jgi:hypothetical protein
VPSELHANLDFLKYLVDEILKYKEIKMVCNSEGTDELPENGTQLPKHIEAEK